MKIEKWECNVCGSPCRVEITYESTKYKHVEAQDRFISRGCPCKEDVPHWHRITEPNPDGSVEHVRGEG